MTKTELNEKTEHRFNETHDALQAIYDELNQGQRKKTAEERENQGIDGKIRGD